MFMFKEPGFLTFANHYGMIGSRFIGYSLEGLMHTYMHIWDDFDDDIETPEKLHSTVDEHDADMYYEESFREDWYVPVAHR